MPRHFRPKGGFKPPTHTAIMLDDEGMSHTVHHDGSSKPVGHVNTKQQFTAAWTASELENLVKGGTWEEFSPPPALPTAVASAASETPRATLEADAFDESPADAT